MVTRNNIYLPLVVVFALFFTLTNVISGAQKGNLLDSIQDSFIPKAFAESDGYGSCYNLGYNEAQAEACEDEDYEALVCLAEGNNTDLDIYFSADDAFQDDAEDILIETAQDTGSIPSPVATVTPASQTYPGSTAMPATHTVNIEAPTLPDGTNYMTLPILSTVTYTDGSAAENQDTVSIDAFVAKAPEPPELTNAQPLNFSATVTSLSDTIDLPVSIDYSDANEDISTLTFELTNDNFNTILQSQAYTGVEDGQTVEHTFTNLPIGSYNWHVIAQETTSNVPEACADGAYFDPTIDVALATTASTNIDVTVEEGLADTGLVSSTYIYFAAALATLGAGGFVRLLQKKKIRL
jgi:hypothetical protein